MTNEQARGWASVGLLAVGLPIAFVVVAGSII